MCTRWNAENENQIALSCRAANAVEMFDLTKSYSKPVEVFTSEMTQKASAVQSHSFVENFVFASFGPSAWKSVVMGGTNTGSVRIWDIRTDRQSSMAFGNALNQKRRATSLWKTLSRSDVVSSVKTVMMSSDNNLALAVHADGIVQIWDVRYSPEAFDLLQMDLPARMQIENLAYTSKISYANLVDDYLLFCQTTDGSIIKMNLSNRENAIVIRSSTRRTNSVYYMDRKFSYCPSTGHLTFATGKKNYLVPIGGLYPNPKPDIIVSGFQCPESDKISVSQANPSLPYHGVCGFESGHVSAYGII
jgi:hypothetical protein